MSTRFKAQVREHLEARALSVDQLAQLQSALAGTSPVRAQSPSARVRFAAVAAFFAALSFALLYGITPRLEAPDIAYRIADEVAANHLHAKPLEVQTGSMAVLRGYFKQLGFMPVETPARGRALQLLGGRYCSLQGETAAQLRMRDLSTGAVESLYQTEYDPDVFGQLPPTASADSPLVVYARGLQVTIWVEKGLVFALTREPAAEQ